MTIQHSENLQELATALAKAQAKVKGAAKDSLNPHFQSKYADLSSIWDACRDALTSNGFSVAQFPGFENGVVTLDTMLLHSSGQWIRGTSGAPIGKQDAQGVGSALTYLRRYALAAVASVSPEDDDGQAASTKSTKTAPRGMQSAGVAIRAEAKPAEPRTPAPDLTVRPDALRPEPSIPAVVAGSPLRWKEKPLTDYPSDDLVRMRNWCLKNNPVKWSTYIEAMDALLAARQGE